MFCPANFFSCALSPEDHGLRLFCGDFATEGLPFVGTYMAVIPGYRRVHTSKSNGRVTIIPGVK